MPSRADSGRPAFAEGHLWRIAKPGIGDSFAFGTIHIADPRVSAIPRQVEAVLPRVRTLAMELPPVEVVDAQVFALEELEDGGRLEPLHRCGRVRATRARARRRRHAQPVVARLKPWAAMMKMNWSGAHGNARSLDENLLTTGLVRRMQIVSLESIEEQIAAFDTIPLDLQVALLKYVLADCAALSDSTEWTIDAWLAGDLAGLARIPRRLGRKFPGMGLHYAQLTRHVIEDRTIVMHHRLFVPLRGGRVLVAIGASHLYGDRGLLAMLRNDGYRITRVW